MKDDSGDSDNNDTANCTVGENLLAAQGHSIA